MYTLAWPEPPTQPPVQQGAFVAIKELPECKNNDEPTFCLTELEKNTLKRFRFGNMQSRLRLTEATNFNTLDA